LRRHTFLQQESARSLKEIREISSRDPEKTPWNGITPYPEHVALDQLESHGRRSLSQVTNSTAVVRWGGN
jgi:hypothetical protein